MTWTTRRKAIPTPDAEKRAAALLAVHPWIGLIPHDTGKWVEIRSGEHYFVGEQAARKALRGYARAMGLHYKTTTVREYRAAPPLGLAVALASTPDKLPQ